MNVYGNRKKQRKRIEEKKKRKRVERKKKNKIL